MRRPPLSIDIEAASLLRAFLSAGNGIQGWNDLMAGLQGILLGGPSGDGEGQSLALGLLMEGEDLNGLSLPGIDLSPVYMERCRLDGCDLRGASLSICRRCSFLGSDIRGASFHLPDLTDADFTGSSMDPATVITRGLHDEGHPPRGLPDRLLRCCRADPAEEREPLSGTRVVAVKVAANLYVPTR